MRIVLVVLGVIALTGCETRAYKELYQEHEALKMEHGRMKEQMTTIWQQSLKARLPLVKEIAGTDEAMPIELKYIKSIQLQPNKHYENKWVANVTYLTDEASVTPNYILYLFDEQGLNIAAHRVKPAMLRKLKLKAGVAETKSEEIELLMPRRPPRFYWIEFVKD